MTQPTVEGTLNTNGATTIGPDGTGYIRFTVTERWIIRTISVRTDNPSVNEQATVGVYVGPARDDAYFREGTFTGGTGDLSDTVYQLLPGDTLWIEWKGGNPGDNAKCVITGSRFITAPSFRAW